MPRRLLFALLPFAAAATTMATLTFTTKSAQPRAAVVAAPLTVTTKPTEWRAPGVSVTVGGFAGSGARVLLRADGRVVAATTAGTLGRYTFASLRALRAA